MIFNTTLAGGKKKWRRPCLKFSSEGLFQIRFSNLHGLGGKVEVSFDEVEWRQITGNDTIQSTLDPQNSGLQVLYVCGTGNTNTSDLFNGLGAETLVDCSGYIESVLDWETVALEKRTRIKSEYCFEGLFSEWFALRSAPSILPSTILGNFCCAAMFVNCVNLETLPKLFEKNIPDGAYMQMFEGCSKIMLSETQSDDYPTSYRIPFVKDIEDVGHDALNGMFANTGGTFSGTPEPNKTYYLHKSCKII